MNEEKVEELIRMLDQFVEDGGGHMNIEFNAESDDLNVDIVEYQKGLDNCSVNSACQVPTIFIDDDE